ncbi:MAG: GNAT family N-acetyltransferase [Ferruginibacter sp.]|nr:GNAT family N-acetyltransferase [Ferruginibacter sp.]
MENFSFLPFKNLESQRLLLREITTDDVNEIFELRGNREAMKYIPRPLCITTEDAMEHVKMIQQKIETNEGINWAITLKSDNKLIGYIGHYRIKWEHFRSEIGYMILPKFNGQGIITEAIKLIVDYGFNEMKMHSLEGIIDPENAASARVLEKNGFAKEAHLRENEFFDGKFIDSVIYSLVNR